MARIYRAQSKKHEDFIPTALRKYNFSRLESWLEKEKGFEVTKKLISEMAHRSKEHFHGPEHHPDDSSIKAYYLSVRNILENIHENQIIKNFINFDEDHYHLFKNSNGEKLNREETIREFDNVFFGFANNLSSFTYFQSGGCEKLPFLKLSHHFQHFNLIFEDLLYIDEPLYKANNVCEKKPDAFPTMCLDFSDDLDVMKAFQFITDNSVVYSIDIDKVPPYIYDSYKRNYDWESKINKYDLRIGKNTNKLMKLQKGYCIYWPWKYTIKELIENEMFGFRVEQLPGKTSSSVNVNIAVNITGA